MLGWCEILMKKSGYQNKALKYFKECMELPGGSKDINTLVGVAKCHASLKRWDDALDNVNQAVVQHPKNLPCLLEKMNVLLAIQDWEQAFETSNRILAADANCIQAKAVTVLYMLCLEGKYSEVKFFFDQIFFMQCNSNRFGDWKLLTFRAPLLSSAGLAQDN